MAGVMPTTAQEANMKILQQIAVAMTAPDADIEALTQQFKDTLSMVRQPYDTPSKGTPVGQGAAMPMGNGATAPAGPAPGALSPMLAALLGGGGAGGGAPSQAGPMAPGTFQAGGLATRTAPNMDEVRRMLGTNS